MRKLAWAYKAMPYHLNIFASIPYVIVLLCNCPSLYAATFVVGSNWNSADQNPGDGICQTSFGPPENCSLIAAIQEANAHPGPDTIVFSKPLTFYLSSSEPLPTISDSSLTIDGSSQWDTASHIPGIVLDNFGDIVSLTIGSGITNTVITGLLFQGNGTGIRVWGSGYNRIGGPGDHERNVFYGYGAGGTGVDLMSPGATVQYNYFGTKNGETWGLDDIYLGGVGIHAYGIGSAPETIIEHNVIGEQKKGIYIEGAGSVKVRNNYIGEPDYATNSKISNEIGIALYNTSAEITTNLIAYNTIAQISTVESNGAGALTISGNSIGDAGHIIGEGIYLQFPLLGSTITNNDIRHLAGNGISVNIGVPAIEDNSIHDNYGDGIFLNQGLVGATVSGNSIYSNHGNGIVLDNSHEVVVSGNTIGKSGMGNHLSGIRIQNGSQDNLIGGLGGAAQNAIGYNYQSGIYITDAGTRNNDVAGNIIGAGPHYYNIAVGYLKAGNGHHGIALYNNAESNNIGLSGDLISPNIIVDNRWSGIAVVNSNHNRIFGNMVGTDGATRLWGNDYFGINIVDGNNNIMKYNEVTNNGFQGSIRSGIEIKEVTPGKVIGNQLSENSIYNNGSTGIALINGANMNIQPPTLQRSGNIFSGTACANCTVELFSGRDKDEGAFFEGSVKANGLGNFSLIKSNHVKSTYVTATATSTPAFNTSEFSLPVAGYAFPWAQFLPAMFNKR
jgi:parallel beta-helix repeat protein